jgi:hypothetical protein
MWTLSVDPKLYNNMDEATKALSEAWNSVKPTLEHRYGNIRFFRVLEFGTKNNMPHYHVLIDGLRLNPEDVKWFRDMWRKHTGGRAHVVSIRDAGAARYVKKYLRKTFDAHGNRVKGGDAWAYWVTNAQFFSFSKDFLPDTGRIGTEEAYALICLALMLRTVVEEENYEYIGVCSAGFIGEPPPEIMNDEWLLSHGWYFDEYWGHWMSPG